MNKYYKFYPNVWLAECSEEHNRGDIVQVFNKYNQAKEHIIHNHIASKNGLHYYSITRADGFNKQVKAAKKAEKYATWAESAEKKSLEYYEASREGADFLALGEPIKIGHHSEKKHRALIERNDNRMRNSVEQAKRAEEHLGKSENWSRRTEDIDLSMPESLQFFTAELEKAKKEQEGLKNGSIPKEHSYSLTYATKKVKELTKKVEIANKLWSHN